MLRVMTKMSDRIRDGRKALKLTQEDLARAADLGSQTIWRLEHDEGESLTSSVEKVARALGVTVDYLLHGNEAPRERAAS